MGARIQSRGTAPALGLGLLHQAPVEHFPRVGQFVKVADHRILNQLAARASAFQRHAVELRLHGGSEVHFHCRYSFSEDTLSRYRAGAGGWLSIATRRMRLMRVW